MTQTNEQKQIEKGNAYAALVEKQIESLFAASRDAEDDEIGPYTHLMLPNGEVYFGQYVAFCGQGAKDELAMPEYVEQVEDEVRFIVEAVQERFPSHFAQRLIWRKRPAFEILPAQKAEPRFGIEARPAAQQIYCRLVGVPMDAEFVGKWREERAPEPPGRSRRPLRIKS